MDFFADNGLGDSEYAVVTSVGGRSESVILDASVVGDVPRLVGLRVKIEFIAFGVDYIKSDTPVKTPVTTKPARIILIDVHAIGTFEYDPACIRDHFERAIGVGFFLIALKGIGRINRYVMTAFVRKVDELG